MLAVPLPLPAPDRVALLLPWLNGDELPPGDVRAAVSSFVSATARAWGATGGADSVVIHAPSAKGSPWRSDRLARLRDDLAALLDRANPPAKRRLDLRALPSLRWDIGRDTPDRKVSALTARQRRVHRGPGAYRIVVQGELDDLVTYGLMRTLTEPGAVALKRCPAPAPRDWSRRCGRWLVAFGQRRGRPREYCSLACRVRAHAQGRHEQAAETLRRKRRATKKQRRK